MNVDTGALAALAERVDVLERQVAEQQAVAKRRHMGVIAELEAIQAHLAGAPPLLLPAPGKDRHLFLVDGGQP